MRKTAVLLLTLLVSGHAGWADEPKALDQAAIKQVVAELTAARARQTQIHLRLLGTGLFVEVFRDEHLVGLRINVSNITIAGDHETVAWRGKDTFQAFAGPDRWRRVFATVSSAMQSLPPTLRLLPEHFSTGVMKHLTLGLVLEGDGNEPDNVRLSAGWSVSNGSSFGEDAPDDLQTLLHRLSTVTLPSANAVRLEVHGRRVDYSRGTGLPTSLDAGDEHLRRTDPGWDADAWRTTIRGLLGSLKASQEFDVAVNAMRVALKIVAKRLKSRLGPDTQSAVLARDIAVALSQGLLTDEILERGVQRTAKEIQAKPMLVGLALGTAKDSEREAIAKRIRRRAWMIGSLAANAIDIEAGDPLQGVEKISANHAFLTVVVDLTQREFQRRLAEHAKLLFGLTAAQRKWVFPVGASPLDD